MATTRRLSFIVLGVFLLAVGLGFHLLAADAEGGRALHYRHHIFGFFIMTVVPAILIALLGRRFWKGRHDITWLIVGALQTIFGLLVYLSFRSS
jgi:hypothetical protein